MVQARLHGSEISGDAQRVPGGDRGTKLRVFAAAAAMATATHRWRARRSPPAAAATTRRRHAGHRRPRRQSLPRPAWRPRCPPRTTTAISPLAGGGCRKRAPGSTPAGPSVTAWPPRHSARLPPMPAAQAPAACRGRCPAGSMFANSSRHGAAAPLHCVLRVRSAEFTGENLRKDESAAAFSWARDGSGWLILWSTLRHHAGRVPVRARCPLVRARSAGEHAWLPCSASRCCRRMPGPRNRRRSPARRWPPRCWARRRGSSSTVPGCVLPVPARDDRVAAHRARRAVWRWREAPRRWRITVLGDRGVRNTLLAGSLLSSANSCMLFVGMASLAAPMTLGYDLTNVLLAMIGSTAVCAFGLRQAKQAGTKRAMVLAATLVALALPLVVHRRRLPRSCRSPTGSRSPRRRTRCRCVR